MAAPSVIGKAIVAHHQNRSIESLCVAVAAVVTVMLVPGVGLAKYIHGDTNVQPVRIGDVQMAIGSGSVEQAVVYCGAILRRDKRCTRAYYFRSMAWKHLGRMRLAEIDIQRAISLNGSDRDVWCLASEIYECRGRWTAAIGAIDKIEELSIDKGRSDLKLMRARNQTRLKRYNAALDQLNDVLAQPRAHTSEAYYYRAICQEHLGKPQAALKDYEASMDILRAAGLEDTEGFRSNAEAVKRLRR